MSYRFFDLIYSGLAGALGAMLGAILGHIAKRIFSLNKPPMWLVPVGIAISIAYSSAIKPPIEKWFVQITASSEVDKAIAAIPLYEVIKEYEPDLYTKLRLKLISGIKSDATSGEIAKSGRAILQSYISDKIPYVRDETIVGVLDVAHREGLSMLFINPQVCADFFFGRFSGEIKDYVPQEILDRDISISAEVIKQVRISSPYVLNNEQANLIIEKALSAFMAKFPSISEQDLSNAFSGTGDPNATCNAMLTMTDEILKLPRDQAAGAWRWLLLQR